MFHKILIANRGEIALRIIRTCRELGIRTVVAHSKADTDSLPVRLADESICVGPDVARLSYLNIPAIISAAAVTDSEAIHPGYGFLAENAAFAEVCRACSITFIGPSPEAIRLMGDKAQARMLAKQAGVAVVPGSELPLKDSAEALETAERDGSMQRRDQKLIEESPAPSLSAETRSGLHRAALTAAAAVNYVSAGTVEFLVDAEEQFYFIEMNTRLQVEHPVTEMVTGIDLVREQIRVATGAPLAITQESVTFNGHAIECRINAENPDTFMPSPGRVSDYHSPGGLGVRVDSALYARYHVPPTYDSLIAKLIVHGSSRNECLMRLRRALEEFVTGGIDTTISLHQRLTAAPEFIDGAYDIRWLEKFV